MYSIHSKSPFFTPPRAVTLRQAHEEYAVVQTGTYTQMCMRKRTHIYTKINQTLL